jgi:cellulose synthase/poly-beta-1,6-N-acetylglucosamine synthase-like glycosyltransferase
MGLLATLCVGSLILALYPLLGYPLLIELLGWLRPRPVARQPYSPSVTVLVPAYNEAEVIAQTIENLLLQRYPAGQLQIIVVSDGSDDGTDDIVRRYAARGVQLLRREPRRGKAAGLNAAMQQARGEVIVFSDANARFAPDAVAMLAENFADPRIGYVTGQLNMLHRAGNQTGEGASGYIRYENRLRVAESRAGSVIGVNGGVDSMRRVLYRDVPDDQITDFVLPLQVIAAGYRVVYDPRACSSEEANEELGSEFRMRVRVALRALRGLWYMRRVLNPFVYPLAAFCVISHKLLRYLTFLFLIAAFLSSALLAGRSPAFRLLLELEIVALALAAVGLLRGLPSGVRRITGLASYFLVSNAAFAVATLRFLRGESMATWRPRGG